MGAAAALMIFRWESWARALRLRFSSGVRASIGCPPEPSLPQPLAGRPLPEGEGHKTRARLRPGRTPARSDGTGGNSPYCRGKGILEVLRERHPCRSQAPGMRPTENIQRRPGGFFSFVSAATPGSLRTWLLALLLFAAGVVPLGLWRLGAVDVVTMEGIVADGARHMVRSGDYLVPQAITWCRTCTARSTPSSRLWPTGSPWSRPAGLGRRPSGPCACRSR